MRALVRSAVALAAVAALSAPAQAQATTKLFFGCFVAGDCASATLVLGGGVPGGPGLKTLEITGSMAFGASPGGLVQSLSLIISGGSLSLPFNCPTAGATCNFAYSADVVQSFDAGSLVVRYQATTGGPVRSFSAADVTLLPEPQTYAMLATGLVGIGAIGWRRRKQIGAV